MTVEQLLSECDLVRLTAEKLATCKPFSCGEDDLDEFFAKEHVDNNAAVRKMLTERGIIPENLPAAEDVKKVERRLASEKKKMLGKKKP